MIKKIYTTTTNRVSQSEIWDLITDVNNWNKWDKGTEFSEIKGDFITGNFFILKPIGSGKVKIEITSVKPKSYYCDLTKFPLARMYDEHFYEITPDGLKITIALTMKGILGFFWYKLVMKNIFENIESDINNQINAIINGRK